MFTENSAFFFFLLFVIIPHKTDIYHTRHHQMHKQILRYELSYRLHSLKDHQKASITNMLLVKARCLQAVGGRKLLV